MKEVGISVAWISSGMYLVIRGCMSYWVYSDPYTVWVGTLPEIYPIAHIYIGIKAILVGARLSLTPSIVKEELMDFTILLIVFTAIVLGKELVIYGTLIANDYLLDELYLWLYSGLILITLVQLKKIGSVSNIWDRGTYRYKNAIRFKKTVLQFAIALIVLPMILRYDNFNFLH